MYMYTDETEVCARVCVCGIWLNLYALLVYQHYKCIEMRSLKHIGVSTCSPPETVGQSIGTLVPFLFKDE